MPRKLMTVTTQCAESKRSACVFYLHNATSQKSAHFTSSRISPLHSASSAVAASCRIVIFVGAHERSTRVARSVHARDRLAPFPRPAIFARKIRSSLSRARVRTRRVLSIDWQSNGSKTPRAPTLSSRVSGRCERRRQIERARNFAGSQMQRGPRPKTRGRERILPEGNPRAVSRVARLVRGAREGEGRANVRRFPLSFDPAARFVDSPIEGIAPRTDHMSRARRRERATNQHAQRSDEEATSWRPPRAAPVRRPEPGRALRARRQAETPLRCAARERDRSVESGLHAGGLFLRGPSELTPETSRHDCAAVCRRRRRGRTSRRGSEAARKRTKSRRSIAG